MKKTIYTRLDPPVTQPYLFQPQIYGSTNGCTIKLRNWTKKQMYLMQTAPISKQEVSEGKSSDMS
jgi:hypothetical protein